MVLNEKQTLVLALTVFIINIIITLFFYCMTRNSPGKRGPRGIPGERGLPYIGFKD